MREVNVVRARYLAHIADKLDAKGIPVERYLAGIHVPRDLLQQPDAIVSALSLLQFMELAVRDTGWDLLGYEAGSVPIADHGPVGSYIMGAPTLYQAARRLITGYKRETSITDDYIAFEGGMAWICITPTLGSREQKQQVELYNLNILQQLVRSALGSGWVPERVKICATEEQVLAEVPGMARLDVEFGADTTAIALPIDRLAAPLRKRSGSREWKGDEQYQDGMLTLDTMNALRRLVETYLPYNPTLEMVSRLTGISRRSLQRFLEAHGTSFSRLVEQVMLNRAIQLLGDTRLPLKEVARELGYSELAHFSRAFRRMTGLAPSAYREKTLPFQGGGD